MKLILKILPLLLVSGSIMCCDSPDSDNLTEGEPYLYIHAKPLSTGDNELWVMVTNGEGQIVDYIKFGPQGGEATLTARRAPLNELINVYTLITQGNANEKYYHLKGTLGVTPGKHFYNTPDNIVPDYVEDLEERSLYATVNKVPIKSILLGAQHRTWSDWNNFDDVMDVMDIEFDAKKGMPVYPFIVHTRESHKYLPLDYEAISDPKLTYPEGFKDFDYTIDIPTGSYNILAIVDGVMNTGASVQFLNIVNQDEIELLAADKSMKLCYLTGFDFYMTSYVLVFKNGQSRSYYKIGGIPEAEKAIIPNRYFTVTNTDLHSFDCTQSSEIDYRTSWYTLIETKEGVQYTKSIYLTSDVKGHDKFDLKLPGEFVKVHGDLDFDRYEYMNTTFTEFENDEPYSRAIDLNFNVPGSLNPLAYYRYSP